VRATVRLAVRYRLLGDDCELDANRAAALLGDDFGIDRLESFGPSFPVCRNTPAPTSGLSPAREW